MRQLCFSLLLCLSATVRAQCSCLWQGSFAEVQANASIVVSGTIRSGKGNSVDLSIERLLRGSEYQPAIRIWLKTADYCRPDAAQFPINSQWVMALHRIERDVPGGFNPDTPNVSYGRIGDYELSNCGGYWLSLNGEWVSGNLINAPRWEREPKMTPVLLDLVADYVQGKVPAEALLQASRVDPALHQLQLDTRAFLRSQE